MLAENCCMTTPATPKDAAAVILLRPGTDPANPEVFWARRGAKMVFGGFHAFPGGQRDATDADVPVRFKVQSSKCKVQNPPSDAMIACAARELFEELGVLVARGAETLTVGQRASVLDDLTSGRMTWPELLAHYGLELDAADFTFAGRWVTPPFAPRRFDTWFFLVRCPPKQQPNPKDGGELEAGEWIAASEAVKRWERAEVVIVPPILHGLKTVSNGLTDDMTERFLSLPQAHGEVPRRIEFRPGFLCFPVRTPTKPPATHTNCYLVGGGEFVVIDPASPYEDEQIALAQCVDDFLAEGRELREIILTHLHPDHVGGANALRQHLGGNVPLAAHRLTAEALGHAIPVDRLIEDEELITLRGWDYIPTLTLRALHTPGHARGHLCFYEEATGALITADNIVGLGSVLIDPPEGNMRDYLASLARMRALPYLTILLGAHGPIIATPHAKIDEYIAHRLEREANILCAIQAGANTIAAIVTEVYTDVHPKALPMAERAVLAHLEKLQNDGAVRLDATDVYFAV